MNNADRERRISEVAALGMLAPKSPPVRVEQLLASLQLDELDTLVRNNRVSVLVAERLQGVPGSEPLLERLRDSNDAIAHRHANLARITKMLDEIGTQLGVPIVGIKGLVSRELYSPMQSRHIGDVDLYVERVDDAFRLAEVLVARGYGYHSKELPWIKRQGERMYGQIVVGRRRSGDRFAFDIHYGGGYSIRHCGFLPLKTPSTPGFHLLDRSQNVALLAANSGGDYFISAKDLNDLYLYLKQDTIDWGIVRAAIRTAKLEGAWNALLNTLRERFSLSETEMALCDTLKFAGYFEPGPEQGRYNKRRRAWVTALHAVRVGLSWSPVAAVKAFATAAVYYNVDLRLRKWAGASLRSPNLRSGSPWTCVRLVPVAIAADAIGAGTSRATPDRDWLQHAEPLTPEGVLQLVDSADGALVASARSLFVPTVWGLLDAHAIARLQNYEGTVIRLVHENTTPARC